MLILQKAVFLHVPKTGGTWVREAIRAAGVSFEELLVEGDQHADLSYCPRLDTFKFAFVRHPLSLYQSYWRFKVANQWDSLNPFDMDCAAPSFNRFVENVLAKHPRWCSRMFEDYVGVADQEIEFIGRFERLEADLTRALTLVGETFDEAAISRTPPVNASVGPSPSWSPQLVSAIQHSERDAMTRFGYDVGEGGWHSPTN